MEKSKLSNLRFENMLLKIMQAYLEIQRVVYKSSACTDS